MGWFELSCINVLVAIGPLLSVLIMNEREVLILTKQKGTMKNATRDITNIVDLEEKFEITYKQNKTYTYNKSNVEYFDQPEAINLDRSIIRIKNQSNQKWDSAVIFGPYICLFHKQYSRLEVLDDVDIIPNIAVEESTKRLIEYYHYISNLLKDQTPHLSIYYNNKLDVIREDSILNVFVNKRVPHKKTSATPLIFPFGINPSQRQAVINALETQVSLIQGPPGTGKTQTILNIIANLMLRGKSVAVVAGNNSATANVYEKLEKENISFLAAKLGNKALQKDFFANEHNIPDISRWELPPEEHLILRQKLEAASEQVTKLLGSKNQLATIKETLNRLTIEKQYFERHFLVESVNPGKWSFTNK